MANFDGVILIDKPAGITSNKVLSRLKGITKLHSKIGHTGSLDPLATGMLPIVLGEATKVASYLLDADKSYQVTAQLGEQTDTADKMGQIINQQAVDYIKPAVWQKVLTEFLGEQQQIPPMYSAVKVNGKRLHTLARKGKVIERQPRTINISELKLLDYNAQLGQFSLQLCCSKGTYVRTLIEDIAAKLGSVAHVISLRRLYVAPFVAAKMHSLEELAAGIAESGVINWLAANAMKIPALLPHMPKVHLDPVSKRYIMQGQPVMIPKAPSKGLVVLLAEQEVFCGLGIVNQDGLVAPKRLVKQLNK